MLQCLLHAEGKQANKHKDVVALKLVNVLHDASAGRSDRFRWFKLAPVEELGPRLDPFATFLDPFSHIHVLKLKRHQAENINIHSSYALKDMAH